MTYRPGGIPGGRVSASPMMRVVSPGAVAVSEGGGVDSVWLGMMGD